MIDLRKCRTSFPKKLLRIGMLVEMEHTKDKKKALNIARQHMCELGIGYYPALIRMEKQLKARQRRKRR